MNHAEAPTVPEMSRLKEDMLFIDFPSNCVSVSPFMAPPLRRLEC